MTRPLPNRVDPFGALFSTPERGEMMGNRGGRFHRPDQTLGQRRWASRQWICCVLAFKGRRRDVWAPRAYTELFFLDEVTALAAGHRPCFECRRAAAKAFAAAFADPAAPAGAMDATLHRERLGERASADLDSLPDGAMVSVSGRPLALRAGAALPWTPAGYGAPAPRPAGAAVLLTPPATVKALMRGYQPAWHRSAGG